MTAPSAFISAGRWVLFAVLAGYAALFAILSPFVLLDFPNHYTRCRVMGDLLFDGGKVFGGLFTFHPEFSPYILHDLVLALLIRLSGEAAAPLWASAALFLPLLSVLAYFRSIGIAGTRLAIAALVLLYLMSDWFFLSGFLSYRFGIALAFAALACMELMLSRSAAQGGRLRLLLLALLAALLYLTHLASFLFFCLALGSGLVFRVARGTLSIRRALPVILPVAVISAVHLALPHSTTEGSTIFRGPLNKVAALGTMFVRFDMLTDGALFLMFAVILLAGLSGFKDKRLRSRDIKAQELLLCSATALLAFLALPVAAGHVYDIDNRALPFLFIFLLGAALTLLPEAGGRAASATAPLLAVANLAYLFLYLWPINGSLQQYVTALDRIPGGKRVLPVATAETIGRIQPDFHWGSLYTERRAGLVPYLFSGDKNDPMPYFRYVDRPAAPLVYWYSRKLPAQWHELHAAYDYLVITKPFERARLDPATLELVYENETAAVFEFGREL